MQTHEMPRVEETARPHRPAAGHHPRPAPRPMPPWLVRHGPGHAARCPAWRLFCFPYAGGSASVFRGWHAAMDPCIDVLALQLPGRGARLQEPPVLEFGRLADCVTEVVASESRDARFAFFGHSMGALLMFEVTRRLKAQGARLPECVFASGRPAPHLPMAARRAAAMSDAELIGELRRLDGTPREIFEHPDLLAIVLPAVRADFMLLDSWRYEPSPPLDVPVCALAGRHDGCASVEAVAAWSAWTRSGFELLTYDGGHFFLHAQERRVARDVASRLAARGGLR